MIQWLESALRGNKTKPIVNNGCSAAAASESSSAWLKCHVNAGKINKNRWEAESASFRATWTRLDSCRWAVMQRWNTKLLLLPVSSCIESNTRHTHTHTHTNTYTNTVLLLSEVGMTPLVSFYVFFFVSETLSGYSKELVGKWIIFCSRANIILFVWNLYFSISIKAFCNPWKASELN